MTATLNGRLCSEVRVAIPRFGAGTAFVTIADSDPVSDAAGAVTLLVAGLTLRCTAVHQGERNGLRSVELVTGYGGWRKPAPMVGGGFFLGNLKLSTYALALAKALGEDMVVTATDRAIGPVAARLGGESSAGVLSLACASPSGAPVVPWFVANDGVTTLGPRPVLGEITADATDSDDLERWYVYNEEDASALMPGATLGGRPVEELRIEATPDVVRQVVSLGSISPAPGSFVHTLGAALRRFVLETLGPRVAAARIYRYRVSSASGGRIKARPVRTLLAPDLEGATFWPGLAGGRAQPKEGSEILVQFADGDIGYPVVVAFMPATVGSGGIPVVTELDGERVNLGDGASGELVARLTDEGDTGELQVWETPTTSGVYAFCYLEPAAITTTRWFTVMGGSVIPGGGGPPLPPGDSLVLTISLRTIIDAVNQNKVYA